MLVFSRLEGAAVSLTFCGVSIAVASSYIRSSGRPRDNHCSYRFMSLASSLSRGYLLQSGGKAPVDRNPELDGVFC